MPVDFLTDAHRQQYGHYTGDPTPEQLARFFYLDDRDRQLIAHARTAMTQLGLALQLCTVRFLGTFLADPTAVPPSVLMLLAQQVGIPQPADIVAYRTNPVRWHHTALIRQQYGYHDFTTQPGHFRFVRWLLDQAWYRNERPSVLFDRATAWLLQQKILLPGTTVLERLIAQVRDRADRRLWRVLTQHVTPDQHVVLAQLLQVPPGDRLTLLERLRRAPTRQSGHGLLEALGRLTDIRTLNIGAVGLTAIPAHRIHALFRFATTARVQAIARLGQERRTATLLAFVSMLEATAQDDALDLLTWFLSDVFVQATRAGVQTRIRTLKDLDAAALILATVGCVVLDPTVADTEIREIVLAATPSADLAHAVEQVADLTRPPDDLYYAELAAHYRRVGRVRPHVLRTLDFAALPGGQAVLDAYRFLQQLEPTSRPTLSHAPRAVITRKWRPYVIQGTSLDRVAYTYCVLDRLNESLRRRDLFVSPSLRYADPRSGMIDDATWPQLRPQVCRMLGRHPNPSVDLDALAVHLDTNYRMTAANLPTNAAVTITTSDGLPDLRLAPLEKLAESSSLRVLREACGRLLPHADLPQVMLEIHGHTKFADTFTHLTDAQAWADDLPRSICAVLVAEACNVGLGPVTHPDIPALQHDRLEWVAQNYLRPETLARANACLVDAHRQIDLVQAWGSGEVASVDGMRFVVPISTIKAGTSQKYFHRERGVTYLNLTSDHYTELNGMVVTGILRDSVSLVSLLLGQQTNVSPREIMTDMGSYADHIFGLLWLLGYQFSPRITDAGGARFWRIDRTAEYGALDDVARHPINLGLIMEQWDELLRLAGSLTLGVFHIESLMRTLQRRDRPTRLAKALAEVGRIIKTLYLLAYVDDEQYRRRILIQLNRGEGRNRLARAVFHGQRGELRQRYRAGQEDQLGALGLVVNIIVLWNTLYLDQAIKHLRTQGHPVHDADVAHLSPLRYAHMNLVGRYSFEWDTRTTAGTFRPLRTS
jgi:TnpA family transposase